ncbi:MAG: GNAT family N-acetyltransferase [Gammaproteobacteria bacterium]|nr:MAG: GNAT family N-acetyltransferase [Gammaproteobacteria bacterium]
MTNLAAVEWILRDGRRVTVRPVCPEDRDALQAAIRRLSPEARYARFMSPLRELGPDLLQRAVNPDESRELQLVALGGDGSRPAIVGGARYSAAPGQASCEFAIAILDDWQGIGLARRLLDLLMATARREGFAAMEGYVLASNVRMLAVARKLGFLRVPGSDDPTVHRVRCELSAAGRG